jgi:hypothetical protein
MCTPTHTRHTRERERERHREPTDKHRTRKTDTDTHTQGERKNARRNDMKYINNEQRIYIHTHRENGQMTTARGATRQNVCVCVCVYVRAEKR